MLRLFYNLFDKLTLTKKFHHELQSLTGHTSSAQWSHKNKENISNKLLAWLYHFWLKIKR